MVDPKPIEYELEDNDEKKPPETEAEAIARLQREDEEKARAIGLVKEKHSTKTGKKWMDSIGGNSANATASRLLEQEARAAERKRQARAAGVKLVAMLIVGLVVVGGAAAVACDYMGVINLGMFPKPAPPPAEPVAVQPTAPPPAAAAVAPAPQPTQAVAQKPAIKVLGVIGNATPLPNPPSEDPPPIDSRAAPAPVAAAPPADSPERKRLQRQLDSAQAGVDTVQADLDKVQGRIDGNLRSMYGILPNPRDVVPPRIQWRTPCAMIELEQAQAAARSNPNSAPVIARLHNAQAQVNNLTNYLAADRKLEKDILGRMKSAEAAREKAQAALAGAP